MSQCRLLANRRDKEWNFDKRTNGSNILNAWQNKTLPHIHPVQITNTSKPFGKASSWNKIRLKLSFSTRSNSMKESIVDDESCSDYSCTHYDIDESIVGKEPCTEADALEIADIVCTESDESMIDMRSDSAADESIEERSS